MKQVGKEHRNNYVQIFLTINCTLSLAELDTQCYSINIRA